MINKILISAGAAILLLLAGCGNQSTSAPVLPAPSNPKPAQTPTAPKTTHAPQPEFMQTPQPIVQTPSPYPNMQVLKKVYSPTSPPAGDQLDLVYPEITGLPDASVQQKINTFLKEKAIPSQIDRQTDITTNFQVIYQKAKILDLFLTGYVYQHGAAHGMPIHESYVLNLETGSVYSLQDLFAPGSDYLTKLTQIVKQDDVRKILNDFGNFHEVRATDSIYLDDGGFYLYYVPYEYTPYAAGFPAFRVSYQDVASLLNQNGEFWKALGSPDLSQPTENDTIYNDERTDTQLILSKGFQTHSQELEPSAQTKDAAGNPLYAWIADSYSNSSTKHQVFFFLGNQFLGTDTAKPYSNPFFPEAASSPQPGSIAVQYHHFVNDKEVGFTVTYKWDGQKLNPDGNFSKFSVSN